MGNGQQRLHIAQPPELLAKDVAAVREVETKRKDRDDRAGARDE